MTHDDTDPVVTTTGGRVRGRRGPQATVFLDIPYAAPPAGPLRFAPPRPHAPWSGIRDATAPGPTAPQPRRDAFGALDMSPYFGPGWVQGEDYLTVNVWTPDTGPDTRTALPVLVFVHGGGFVAGSARAGLYDGTGFARDGVVLVTLNYRLGAPGFLHLPDVPDNRGVLDIVAALRWVRDNIAGFGGDPGRVTLAGQSAGATLVGAVLAEPEAEGLFARAAMQSGSGLGAFTTEQAERVTHALGPALALDAAPTAKGLADVSDERLVAVMPRLSGLDLTTDTALDPLAGLTPFSVVRDEQPAEAVAAGRGAAVDLLLGTNSQEGNLYLVPGGQLAATTEDELRASAARLHRAPDALLAAYRAARPRATPGELRSAVLGDALFGAGTWRMADAHATRAREERAAGRDGARTHLYEFGWRSPALDGGLGAAHAVELPFVLDRTDLPELRGARGLLGPDALPAGLADRVHAAWVAFARTGDPGWAPYGTRERTTLRVTERWETVDDPRAGEREAWR
ncbi:carboxylesterase/lipase family protein [Streptomyces sp. NPDC054796]